MIALPAISQQKYIIKGDSIVGYTPAENRKIALIMIEGELCAEQLDVANKTIEIMTTRYDVSEMEKSVSTARIQKLELEYDSNAKERAKLIKRYTRAKQVLLLESGIVVVLTAILILK